MKIYLANPRGFCAGVDRAIEIVELSLKAYGAPIYVRHEIVHSRHVVNSLRQKGAVFVEELHEAPDGAIVIFSAHGVAKEVWEEARRRSLKVIDATCPLVIKVHHEVNRDHVQGYELILIGHAGHPEVIGTLGQIPDKFHLVSSVRDVEALHVESQDHLSYVTQTTLSVDECRDIVQALNRRFPGIKGPHQEDICYATQNRQNAVKELAKLVDVILVIGSPNSSNSNRLRELAEYCGIPSFLIDSAADISPEWVEHVRAVGITAGASAPEILVTEVVDYLKRFGEVDVENLTVIEEDVEFLLPKELVTVQPSSRHSPRFILKSSIVARLPRLPIKRSDPLAYLGDDVPDPHQIVLRGVQLAERLGLLLLVAHDPGRLFDQLAPILGRRIQNLLDAPLLDHGVPFRSRPRIQKQAANILQPARCFVDEVLTVTIAVQPARHHHLVVLAELPFERREIDQLLRLKTTDDE